MFYFCLTIVFIKGNTLPDDGTLGTHKKGVENNIIIIVDDVKLDLELIFVVLIMLLGLAINLFRQIWLTVINLLWLVDSLKMQQIKFI